MWKLESSLLEYTKIFVILALNLEEWSLSAVKISELSSFPLFFLYYILPYSHSSLD